MKFTVLVAVRKIAKATVRFVVSVHSTFTGRIFIQLMFEELFGKFSKKLNLIETLQEKRVLYMKTYVHLRYYLSDLFLG